MEFALMRIRLFQSGGKAMKIYGIKSCDTMRKAFKWLEVSGASFEFHDYKKAGLSPELADEFLANMDVKTLINQRGTTFRQLDDAQKAKIKDEQDVATAKQVMLDNASIVKRPVLEKDGKYLLGFKAELYQEFI